jgi:arsenate reductase
MNVLFVCVGNASRSQMACAWFNRLAEGKAFCDSAGIKPAKEVSPLAVEVMKEVGIRLESKPKKLTPELIEWADLIVALDPKVGIGDIVWHVDDPKGKPIEKYREVRDAIRLKVEELIHKKLKQDKAF